MFVEVFTVTYIYHRDVTHKPIRVDQWFHVVYKESIKYAKVIV